MSNGGFHTVISERATVDDTLNLIINTVNTYKNSKFVGEVVQSLEPTGDRQEFIKRVFDLYCRNVKYKLDEKDAELVWTPGLTFLMGKGDCKKASTFIASVLERAGINPILKHVYYNTPVSNGKAIYTHIYVIVPYSSYRGNFGDTTTMEFVLEPYITLDPTNDCRYNSEVSYKTATLYFLNGKIMELHQMGNSNLGPSLNNVPFSEEIFTGCNSMAMGFNELGGMGANYPGTPQAFHPMHLDILSKLNPGNVKLQMSTVNIPINQQRGAFLELIKNNVDGLASHLAQLLGTDATALNKVWDLVGGNLNELKAEVIKGATQPLQTSISGPEYIGKFSFKNLLHGASNLLKAVAPIANAVVPGAGMAITGLANKAEQLSLSAPVKTPSGAIAPPPELPPNLQGTNIPFGQGGNQGGGSTGPGKASVMGSVGGFIFKSLMLISITHIDIQTKAVLGTVALVAPLLYLTFIKIKSYGRN